MRAKKIKGTELSYSDLISVRFTKAVHLKQL